MNIAAFLMDMAPLGGGIGVVAGIAFFLVFAAIAFVAYKILKKSVKMAFRLAIVAIILLIAVAGSISFWWLGSSKPTRPDRPRPTQSK
jgi:apolipoprotein N-acyltransferase